MSAPSSPATTSLAPGLTLPPQVTLSPSGSDAGELSVSTPACTLRLEMQGAQVLSFTPAGGTDLLWLSPDAVRAPGQAVRGGIPVCAPWFADGPDGQHSPSHGPARTQPWTLTAARVDEAGTAQLTLATQAEGVDLRLAVTAGRQLQLDLTLALPQEAEARHVEAALHTYFAVSAVDDCSVTGLDGATVVDKLTQQVGEQSGTLRPEGAIDRIHRVAGPVTLEDGVRSIAIESQGAADTVVWSPGAQSAAGIDDVPTDGWDAFLCVETACIGARLDGIDHSVRLVPGSAHTLGVTLTASDAAESPAA